MILSAVIPAAGLSSRMHQYKPLLKFGNHCMVEVVIQLFQTCNIQEILVVTGHNHSLLEPGIQKAGARAVFNPNFKTGMFSSIQKGVSQVSSRSQGFFLLPVDIPTLRPATLQGLIQAFEKDPSAVVVPKFSQKTGHPPLIPAEVIPKILSPAPHTNLRDLLKAWKNHPIQVHDRGILLDADTPEDYQALVRRYKRLQIPDPAECRSIIQWALKGEPGIQSHLNLVATTALKLRKALEPSLKKRLDPDLILAAALLHDIKRREKDHARAGSDLLTDLGFPGVAKIVAQHMTLTPETWPTSSQLTETHIVYLADKLCTSTRVEPDYAPRFAAKMKQAPQAQTRIAQRYEAAQQIQARIEAAAGRPLRQIIQ
jgi:CTP:molybdopterin cytidylyltransferase MocA/HD superfamily phosphohydrolase YqeK